MSKATDIWVEAEVAAEKAATLTAFMRTEEYKTLRIENTPLWFNIMSLRGTYDVLSKYLKERARLEEERERAKTAEPCLIPRGRL